MEQVKIGLLGFGTVGQGVARVLEEKKDRLFEHTGKEIVISKILVQNPDKEREVKVDPSLFTTDYFDVVDNDDIDIIVEVTSANDEAKEMMARSLYNKKHVVTANKAAVSKYFEELTVLAVEKRLNFHYEASVAGGTPIIKPLYDVMRINKMERVRGILNGTSNFILSQMTEKGVGYDEALKEAQRLGYAEADPSSDVEGLDTLRKLRILSTIAFKEKIVEEDFITEGITKLNAQDIKHLGKKNKVIKLIGETIADEDHVRGVVQPVAVEKGSYFAAVTDAFNSVTICGDVVGELKFYGAGAGMLPTANAIVSDIIDVVLQNQKPTAYGVGYKRIVQSEEATGKFYVRTSKKNIDFSEIAEEVLSENPQIVITKEMKLKDLMEMVESDTKAAIVRIEDEGY